MKGFASPARVAFVIPPARKGPALVRDLLHGCWCSGKRVGGVRFPPVSLAGLASAVAREGFPPVLLDCPAEGISIAGARKRLQDVFAVVVLSSFFSAREDLSFLEEVKRGAGEIRGILVGPFPTFQPETALAAGEVDAMVRGEPDLALPALLRFLQEPDGNPLPPGTSARIGNSVVSSGGSQIVEDLDGLPFPDRRLIANPRAYANPAVVRWPYTTMFSSRGCASGCRFCPAPAFSLRRPRYRGVDSVMEEVRLLVREGYREIFFRDENFAGDRDRALRICGEFRKLPAPPSWICSSRADHLDRDLLLAMRRSGCHMVRIGVESGSGEVLARCGKGISLPGVEEVFRECRRIGMKTHAHMQVGLPGETAESLRQTLDFIGAVAPTLLTVGVCTPVPGSPLFTDISGPHPEVADLPFPEEVHGRAAWNHLYCDVPADALESAQRTAYRRFYGNPARWPALFAGAVRTPAALRSRLHAASRLIPLLYRG